MATNLGEVIVSFGAETAGFASGIASMSGMMSGWQGLAIGAAIAVSAAFVEVGVAVVNMASTFERNTERIQTTAGLTGGTIDQLRLDMIKMSTDTITSVKDLEAPMYTVVSQFHDMAASEKVMEIAAKGAKIEQADLMTVTGALTTTMKNYKIPVSDAEKVMSAFIETSKLAPITLQGVADTMNKTASQAHTFGVRLTDLLAATALASEGSTNFSMNATGIKNAMTAIENPSLKALKVMKEFGLSQTDIALAMRKGGLADAIDVASNAISKKLNPASIEWQRAFMAVMGVNQRTGSTVMFLAANVDKLHSYQKLLAEDYQHGTAFTKGWADVQTNLQVQTEKLHLFLENLGYTIGLKLLPYIKDFTKWLTPIIDGFVKWTQQGKNMEQLLTALGMVAIGFGAVLAIVAIAVGVVIFVVVALAMLLGTIVYGAIRLVIAIVQNWGNWMRWIGDRFHDLGSTIAGWQKTTVAWFKQLDANVRSIVGGMVSWVGGKFSDLGSTVRGHVNNLVSWVGGKFSDLGSLMRNGVIRGVEGAVSAVASLPGRFAGYLGGLAGRAFSWGSDMIGGFISGILSRIGGVASAIGGIAQTVASHMPHSPAEKGPLRDADKWAPSLISMFVSGLYAGIPQVNTALSTLVAPKGHAMPAYIAGIAAGGVQNIYVQIDGRDLASAVGNQMAKEIRLQLGVK